MAEETSGFEVRDRRRFRDGSSEAAAPDVNSAASADPIAGTPANAGATADSDTTAGAGAASRATEATDQGEASASDQHGGGEDDAGAQDDAGAGGMPDISVMGVLSFALNLLPQLAWQEMGLIANPATGKVQRRLNEARLAIDALAALVPVIGPQMDDTTRRELQTMLANLRINFVEQSKRAASDGPGAAQA